MENNKKEICPVCRGKKYIPGTCECNMEWRGTLDGDNWEDCQCVPELSCSNCAGKGYLNKSAVSWHPTVS